MKRIFLLIALVSVVMLSACGHDKKPSLFAWQNYKQNPAAQKFVYQLPNNGIWLDMKDSRVLDSKHLVPERIKIVRGERPHDFSERFRELYIKEKMDPIEFLAKLRASDETVCIDVEFNILKRIPNGFVYREKGNDCRRFPMEFLTYGKVISTKHGLSNLQYQAVPKRLSGAHIKQMYDVIIASSVKGS